MSTDYAALEAPGSVTVKPIRALDLIVTILRVLLALSALFTLAFALASGIADGFFDSEQNCGIMIPLAALDGLAALLALVAVAGARARSPDRDNCENCATTDAVCEKLAVAVPAALAPLVFALLVVLRVVDDGLTLGMVIIGNLVNILIAFLHPCVLPIKVRSKTESVAVVLLLLVTLAAFLVALMHAVSMLGKCD